LVPAGDHPLLGAATLNVGRIEGGSAINLIPDRCVAELDFRLLPTHDPDALEQSVTQALEGGTGLPRGKKKSDFAHGDGSGHPSVAAHSR
jgi:acetylornithine deacetylase/succinyl-diaminopimelate desuccinylase-like protein